MSYKIFTPIWDKRKIGIALFRLHRGIDLEIEIMYTDKYGQRLYPYVYLLNITEALDYPRSTVKGTELAIVPIDRLRVKCSA